MTIHMIKPAWLNKKISLKDCSQVKSMLKDLGLHTVCEEALCPNMGECFSRRQATFMILGAICTRGCLFCGVAKGKPLAPDADEPRRIVEAVRKLGLTHVVITSVTRDDLPDGGAGAFEKTILALRSIGGGISIETLIPDFNADLKSLRIIAGASPDIIAHNIETVPGLYKDVRPTGASYQRSLEVLRSLKREIRDRPQFSYLSNRKLGSVPNLGNWGLSLIKPKLKSGLMLGLGEKREEVLAVFDDLVEAGCVFLSIGQYLAPSAKHFPVREYLHPRVFEEYKKEALKRGFSFVMSGPYVRSSYAASEYGL
jgi:lipoic acid synthetase